MTTNLYLTLMLGAILILVVLFVPTLLSKRCPDCGARNGLDSSACRQCGKPLPD